MSKGPIERFWAGAIGRVDEDSAREPALSRVAQALAVLEHLDWWQARHAQWRGRECLNLNAANNTMSPAARNALASRLADKAFSGSPGNRLHPGSHYVDLIEDSIAQLGKEVFGANGIEFRPTSGSHANAVAIFSTVNPGDTILALPALAPAHKSYREQVTRGTVMRALWISSSTSLISILMLRR
jgi:glycine/serine hydroxymethyltransferase